MKRYGIFLLLASFGCQTERAAEERSNVEQTFGALEQKEPAVAVPSIEPATGALAGEISSLVPDEVPLPPGLSRVATEDAPGARSRKNASHRVRIEALKAQIAASQDGAAQAAWLKELELEQQAYKETREALLPADPVTPTDDGRGMTASQRDSLIGRMADYDMKNPQDVARWALVKQKELGR